MSLPERQSEYSDKSRADTYNTLDTLMCLHNLETLFEEAKRLGTLATTSLMERELDVDITDGVVRNVNAFDQPMVQFETANFYAMVDDSVTGYRVRHTTENAIRHMDRQMINREFWVFYEQWEQERMPRFDAAHSRYSINLEMIGKSESVRMLPNEGTPLQPLEALYVERSIKDFSTFNGYHFMQIEQLAIRALDSVRSS